MHVRVAPRSGGVAGLSRQPHTTSGRLSVALLITASVIAAGCGGGESGDDLTVDLTMAPTPPVVGASIVGRITLRDGGQPVAGARLQVEGHMSHPGMAPVIVPASERRAGVYEATWQFTMRGDWILLVTGTLPDGRRLSHRIEVPNVQPSG